MIKFKDKYRIETTRLPSWNYGSNAPYFVTICTKRKIKYFGEIQNNDIELNQLGQIAQKFWIDIPQFHPFVELDNFIVMPNHIHGIIVINKSAETQGIASDKPISKIETQGIASLQKNRFGPQSQHLASIIRGFKSGITQYAREHKIAFHWQSRYYDHIIRNNESWEIIRQNIRQNHINCLNHEQLMEKITAVK